MVYELSSGCPEPRKEITNQQNNLLHSVVLVALDRRVSFADEVATGARMQRFCGWLVVAFALAAGTTCGEAAWGQGQYSAVTAEDVVALELNHYFTADKKGHQRDFKWKFTKG